MTATISAIRPAGTDLEPTGRRVDHPAALAIGGGAVGYLFGRHHHPLVWACLAGLVFGVVVLVVLAWWAVLAALVLVTAARSHGRGWSAGRYFATFGAWLGAVVVVIIGAAAAGIGGALVGAVLAWSCWHSLIRPRAHQLNKTQEIRT